MGEGAFGKVKIASLHENPGKKFAIKSIPRELMDLAGKMKKEEKMKQYGQIEEMKEYRDE